MSLTLRYLLKTAVPVEIEGVVPERLRDKSLGEIERIDSYHGNRKLPLGELFGVSGDPNDGRIDFEGDLAGVHFIGYRMGNGEIHVHGNAGRHVGGEMTGGRIEVEGNAGDWVGGEMHGGLIHINGSAGDLVGSAYRGSKKGMTDGTILIGGDAGGEIGAAMRRGTLVVGGSCGDATGFGMIAGSILVFGSCGARIGAGMKRGTIGLLGPDPIQLLPTFRRAGCFRPLFLRLLLREIARLGFPVDLGLLDDDLLLYHGDLVALGKGEVWMRASG
jgi:formylmethanofuran dehydrogenase subunit C